MRSKAEIYKEVTDMINDGYKILDYATEQTSSPEERFKNYFTRNQILPKLNSSFFKIPALHNVEVLLLYLSKKVLAVLRSDRIDIFESLLVFFALVMGETNLKCYTVPEQIFQDHIFYEMVVVNQFWLVQTLNLLKESGLDETWNTWATWSFLLSRGDHRLHDEMNSLARINYEEIFIDLRKLYFIIVICMVLFALTIVVFIIECIIKYFSK